MLFLKYFDNYLENIIEFDATVFKIVHFNYSVLKNSYYNNKIKCNEVMVYFKNVRKLIGVS